MRSLRSNSYDRNHSGKLERHEFVLMAEEFGYGEVASELFDSLPTSGGMVNYQEVINAHVNLQARSKDEGSAHANHPGLKNNAMKDFMMAMAWNGSGDTLSASELKRSGWALAASNAEELREELGKLLRWHSLKPSELFRALDEDRSGAISLDEFVRVLQGQFGFTGDAAVLHAAFAQADIVGDGSVKPEEHVSTTPNQHCVILIASVSPTFRGSNRSRQARRLVAWTKQPRGKRVSARDD